MRVRPTRLRPARRRAGAAILATAVLSGGLVAATTTTTSAAPVNTTVQTSCGARDNDAATATRSTGPRSCSAPTGRALPSDLGGDIPETAGSRPGDRRVVRMVRHPRPSPIDKAAALIPSIHGDATSRDPDRARSRAASLRVQPGPYRTRSHRPAVRRPANLPLGTVRRPDHDHRGGIITYRVGAVRSTPPGLRRRATLNLKLACSVTGSNLIAKTTVKRPRRSDVRPEVITLEAAAGGP